MSRLRIPTRTAAQNAVKDLYGELELRMRSSSPKTCPVDFTYSFLQVCQSQTCGKCAACRIGLEQLKNMLGDIRDGRAEAGILDKVEKLAKSVSDAADCALGYEAADMVLRTLTSFKDDYVSHVEKGVCSCKFEDTVPCRSNCPAGIDIPGYTSLVGAGRYADAMRVIRNNNPFPTVCALVCEYPCESVCRRGILDAPVNIRGLKRFAADNAGIVEPPACGPDTGKKVAVVGAGPSGLSCAYYLRLMGHAVTVYESKAKAGGMMRYGIPPYRLPRVRLDEDIDCVLKTGVELKLNTYIGKDISLETLRSEYDAVYMAIGAHTDKKVGIDGEDAENVISAVEFLKMLGDDIFPDYTGKNVIVIGGGNVAMDCARSARRLGGKVTMAYRRRTDDMTALVEEIESAAAEGVEYATLQAPVRVEVGENGQCTALITQPQIISKLDRGRFSVRAASAPEKRLPADIIIVAIGQDIESACFADTLPIKRNQIQADMETKIKGVDGVFAGGDAATGPATAIRAIAAGRTAAANIDEYLGFNHPIGEVIDIPAEPMTDKPKTGRVMNYEYPPSERSCTFDHSECGLTEEEAKQEASRCLRCDKFGFGAFRGGRITKW